MKVEEVLFRGHTIEQWVFGSETFYYPAFNHNAEFTSFKKCCAYVRMCIWINKKVSALTSTELSITL